MTAGPTGMMAGAGIGAATSASSPDPGNTPTGPEQAASTVTGGGDGDGPKLSDFTGLGSTQFDPQKYNYQNPTWGGDQARAQGFADNALVHQAGADDASTYAVNQMKTGLGAQTGAQTVGMDPTDMAQQKESRAYQFNSMNLAKDAAMGNAPSAAQYMMQSGLNQGIANQQAMAGGARGAGGLALAGGNMAGNAAAMQGQAYNQAGQMRAQEMAQARGQYGDMTNQMRASDSTFGNQVDRANQFNAGQVNDVENRNKDRDVNFRQGMGQTGVQYGNLANQNLQTGMHPYDQQQSSDTQMQGIKGTSWDSNEQTRAGLSVGNAQAKAGQVGALYGAGGSVLSAILSKGK